MVFQWLIDGGDPNHLLSGVILQVVYEKVISSQELLGFYKEYRFLSSIYWIYPQPSNGGK